LPHRAYNNGFLALGFWINLASGIATKVLFSRLSSLMVCPRQLRPKPLGLDSLAAVLCEAGGSDEGLLFCTVCDAIRLAEAPLPDGEAVRASSRDRVCGQQGCSPARRNPHVASISPTSFECAQLGFRESRNCELRMPRLPWDRSSPHLPHSVDKEPAAG